MVDILSLEGELLRVICDSIVESVIFVWLVIIDIVRKARDVPRWKTILN